MILSSSHCPLLGCSLLNILILLKPNSVQPFPRTAGLCLEPEWPDPDMVWHLLLCAGCAELPFCTAQHFVWSGRFFCPAILLPITYCISTLLVSFKHQECCQSLSFSIWYLDVQKCYKIEDVLYQHKSFEKNSTSAKSIEFVQPSQKQIPMGRVTYTLQ